MRFWRHLLGGLLLWAAHFFAVYGIASTWPGNRTAVVLVLLTTMLALGCVAWLSAKAFRSWRAASDELQRWSIGLTLLCYGTAGAAICLQALPAGF